MKILSDDYLQRGHFDLGLDLDEKLIELEPSNPDAFFNLACSYSLNGDIQAAADALTLAIDYGYRDWKWIAREQSLEKLRYSSYLQLSN